MFHAAINLPWYFILIGLLTSPLFLIVLTIIIVLCFWKSARVFLKTWVNNFVFPIRKLFFRASIPSHKVIVIDVENTSTIDQQLVLFGSNRHLSEPNFGNPESVKITTGSSNVTYGQILQQIKDKKYETNLMRVLSMNSAQVTQTLGINETDMTGSMVCFPIITQNYFSPIQFQSGVVDIQLHKKRPIIITGNTHISTRLMAGAKVSYAFYEVEKTFLQRLLKK